MDDMSTSTPRLLVWFSAVALILAVLVTLEHVRRMHPIPSATVRPIDGTGDWVWSRKPVSLHHRYAR